MDTLPGRAPTIIIDAMSRQQDLSRQLAARLAGRIHAADVDELSAAAAAGDGAPVLSALWAALNGEDVKAEANAAWIMTHLPRSLAPWLADHRRGLTDKLLASANDTVRRLTLTLLNAMDWHMDDLRSDLLDFCLRAITSRSTPAGIRAQSLYLAAKMCACAPELEAELRMTTELLTNEDLTAGMRAALRLSGKRARRGKKNAPTA